MRKIDSFAVESVFYIGKKERYGRGLSLSALLLTLAACGGGGGGGGGGDANSVPSFSLESSERDVAENSNLPWDIKASDGDGDTLTYSLKEVDDWEQFRVEAVTGALSFKSAPDYENPRGKAFNKDTNTNIYSVTVVAGDGEGGSAEQAVMITVTGVNDSPVFVGEAIRTIDENFMDSLSFGALDDEKDTLEYTIKAGLEDDAGLFAIDEDTGAVTFKDANGPDYENPRGNPLADDNTNTYALTVEVKDGMGGVTDQAVMVTVTGVDESDPMFGQDKVVLNVNEGATDVSTFSQGVSDEDKDDPLTYSFKNVAGDDTGLFNIDSTTGAVTFKSSPDYENPRGNPLAIDNTNTYKFTVLVRDGDGGDELAVDVVVDNVETVAFAQSSRSVSVDENTTEPVGTFGAVNEEGFSLVYSLSGDDADLFAINADTGEVMFKSVPDFEASTDKDSDSEYKFTVSVTGTKGEEIESDTQAVTVTVEGVNEFSPVFDEVGTESGPLMKTAEENQTAVATFTATDEDTDANLFYSLKEGDDAGLFSIDDMTGEVTFISTPDFENPRNAPLAANNTNRYKFTVIVSDGLNSVENYGEVEVTDVNEFSPVFEDGELFSVSVIEAEAWKKTFTATDKDSTDDTLMYSLSGDDAGDFTIIGDTGEVTFAGVTDFENPTDDDTNNEYEFTVIASDGGDRTDKINVTVMVTDLNENTPRFYDDDGNRVESLSVDAKENQTAVATFTARDEDPTDIVTYSFKAVLGDDAGLFDLDVMTGKVTFKAVPDFENPMSAANSNTYRFTVIAKDDKEGEEEAELEVTLMVTDVNENAPIFKDGEDEVSSLAVEVEEEEAFNAEAKEVATFEASGNGVTYSLKEEADYALFDVEASTGKVTFKKAGTGEILPDYENPVGEGENNDYIFTLIATDGAGQTGELEVTVTVTDVNEVAPAFAIRSFTKVIEEGVEVIGTFTATDEDGTAVVTYSLDGADKDWFDIDDMTGEVKFKADPDFENPRENLFDKDTNTNTYTFTVLASDGRRDSQRPDGGTEGHLEVGGVEVTVNVTDVKLEFTQMAKSNQFITVDENQTAVGTYSAVSDPDATITGYSLADRGLFIDYDDELFEISDMGVLTFKNAPNFESPGGVNKNNDYFLLVLVKDSGSNKATDFQIRVTVRDVNDSPTITLPEPPEGKEKGTVEVKEGKRLIYNFSVSDEDKDAVTLSLSGEDQEHFNLVQKVDGYALELHTTNSVAPSFDSPMDNNGDNEFKVTVTATDGRGGSSFEEVTVKVLDNIAPPDPTVFRLVKASFGEVVTSRDVVFDLVARKGDTFTVSVGGTSVTDTPLEITNFDGSYRYSYTVPDTVPEGSGVLDGNEFKVTVALTDSSERVNRQELTVSYQNTDAFTVSAQDTDVQGRFVTFKSTKDVGYVDISKVKYESAIFGVQTTYTITDAFIDEGDASLVHLKLQSFEPSLAKALHRFTFEEGAFVARGGGLSSAKDRIDVKSALFGLSDLELEGVRSSASEGTVDIHFSIGFGDISLFDATKISLTRQDGTKIVVTAATLTTLTDKHILRLTDNDADEEIEEGGSYTVLIEAGAFDEGGTKSTTVYTQTFTAEGASLTGLEGDTPSFSFASNKILEVTFLHDVSVGIFSRLKVKIDGGADVVIANAYGEGKTLKIVAESTFTNGTVYDVDLLKGSVVDKVSGDVVNTTFTGDNVTYTEVPSLTDDEGLLGVSSYGEYGF